MGYMSDDYGCPRQFKEYMSDDCGKDLFYKCNE